MFNSQTPSLLSCTPFPWCQFNSCYFTFFPSLLHYSWTTMAVSHLGYRIEWKGYGLATSPKTLKHYPKRSKFQGEATQSSPLSLVFSHTDQAKISSSTFYILMPSFSLKLKQERCHLPCTPSVTSWVKEEIKPQTFLMVRGSRLFRNNKCGPCSDTKVQGLKRQDKL